MSYRRYSGCWLAIAVLLAGCQNRDKAQQSAAPQPPEVTVSQALERKVVDNADFTGRTEANLTVDVRSRVRGYLQKIGFVDGQEVKEGQLLFQIDLRPFEAEVKSAEGQKKQWEAKKAQAVADVQRYERLVPTGAATPQDLEKAKANRDEAAAAIQSAEATIDQAKLNLEFASITAPISGQIGRRQVDIGNLIQGGSGTDELLATIVSLDPMYVYFDMNQRLVLRLVERARAKYPPTATQPDIKELKIPVFAGLVTDEGFPRQGVIDFADNKFDPQTGTIRIRGTFDNSTRIFKPGLFVRVQVHVSDPYPAVLVSDRAIGTEQGTKYVLVVNSKNLVEQRFVKPGALEPDGLRVITEGLKPGEQVVVNGLQRARPGKPVTPQVAEMPTRPGEIQATPVVTTQTAQAGGSAARASH